MPLTSQVNFSATGLRPCQYQELARDISVQLAQGTYAAGTVLGEITAHPGRFTAYASGNNDGSQVAKGILQYPCVVDSNFNITLTGEFGVTVPSAPMYVGGYFRIEDTTGLDSGGLTNLGGSVKEGAIGGTGIFAF